jgi:glycosyltransferase involved in cell wall biosynthesis
MRYKRGFIIFMRISFLCPMPLHNPVGGLKVVIEYANRLAERGHSVSLISGYGNVPFDLQATMMNRLKRNFWFFLRSVGYKGGYKPDRWITLFPKVKLRWIPNLDARWIPDADAVVATAWESAEWVATYPDSKGNKFYLIQNNESQFDRVDAKRVEATWKLPLRKLVTGKWLQEILATTGETARWVSQGIDYHDNVFSLRRPIETRGAANIVMMYHTLTWKGSADGLAALHIVKKTTPSLSVELFGVPEAPKGLPNWINYNRNPPQTRLCEIYNDAAIFISPSLLEGMSLPPAEAMQCGVAVCMTNIGGHRDYGVHEKTALLSPPKNPDALAANISRLIENPDLRIQLAINGHRYIQQFTWDNATEKIEQCLMKS